MALTIHEHVIIQPGGRIELICSDLPSGSEADVTVTVANGSRRSVPLSKFFGEIKGGFANAAEADQFLRAERDSWES